MNVRVGLDVAVVALCDVWPTSYSASELLPSCITDMRIHLVKHPSSPGAEAGKKFEGGQCNKIEHQIS
jgi:hypothetical protein